jgi:uncharacterized protein (TIGR03435 family)
MSMGGGGPTPSVVDKTGLAGEFEFKLEFAGPTQTEASGAGESGGGGGQTLFTALEKQLGLKLEKTKKASLDFLVIDHVDKTPTEN